MSNSARPSTIDDAAQIRRFLLRSFELADDCPGFTPDDLNWKYWAPRADWESPRSYLLGDGRKFAAHCALAPTYLQSAEGVLPVAHFIDWAADPTSLLAGVRLLRKVVDETGMLCAVGGSSATRKILPLAGFSAANEVTVVARPVRPFLQAATHQLRNWKLPLRTLRNTAWSFRRSVRPPKGWSYTPIKASGVPAELWTSTFDGVLTRVRQPATYDYFSRCPSVRFVLFLLHYRNTATGCAMLAFVGGQARIADLWVLRPSAEMYSGAYQTAVAAAMTDPAVAEIVAATSTPQRLTAVLNCGFRVRHRDAIMCSGTPGDAHMLFDFQLLDNDSAYLTRGATEYLT